MHFILLITIYGRNKWNKEDYESDCDHCHGESCELRDRQVSKHTQLRLFFLLKLKEVLSRENI